MNIAVIAHSPHPIKQPFAGGLEAHTYQLVAELQRQNHQVTLFAKFGSRTAVKIVPVFYGNSVDGEHPAYNVGYRYIMHKICNGNFDLIINNSLNHTPLEMHDSSLPPMITIFHTPPLPRMTQQLQKHNPTNRSYIAVSDFTARQWQPFCQDDVHTVSNGMDVDNWLFNSQPPSSPAACWIGRITPEKGTHLAIEACQQMGLPIVVGGNIANKKYFHKTVKPLLQLPGVTYAGHLNYQQVNKAFAAASVAIVTPLWDEPFGLVAIEALAAGTPVAALPNGALPSLINHDVGALASTDSGDDLMVAISSAITKNRTDCHDYTCQNFTLQTMVQRYLRLVPQTTAEEVSELSWQTTT